MQGTQEIRLRSLLSVNEQADYRSITQQTLLKNNFHFLSEVVRCDASQKKSPRDSTKAYSPRTLTLSDTPQIAAYHKKLLERAKHKLKLSILVRHLILRARESSPRCHATESHMQLIDINIGVTILLESL